VRQGAWEFNRDRQPSGCWKKCLLQKQGALYALGGRERCTHCFHMTSWLRGCHLIFSRFLFILPNTRPHNASHVLTSGQQCRKLVPLFTRPTSFLSLFYPGASKFVRGFARKKYVHTREKIELELSRRETCVGFGAAAFCCVAPRAFLFSPPRFSTLNKKQQPRWRVKRRKKVVPRRRHRRWSP